MTSAVSLTNILAVTMFYSPSPVRTNNYWFNPFFPFLLVYVTVWIYWQLTKKGKDASTDFDDVNHSNEAKETMKKYCIGDVDKSTVPVTAKYIPPWEKESTAETTKEETGNKMLVYLIPLLILGVAFFSDSTTTSRQVKRLMLELGKKHPSHSFILL